MVKRKTFFKQIIVGAVIAALGTFIAFSIGGDVVSFLIGGFTTVVIIGAQGLIDFYEEND